MSTIHVSIAMTHTKDEIIDSLQILQGMVSDG